MRMRFGLSTSIAVLVGSLLLMAQVKDFRPVTEAMLRNPAPGDWLNWRRTDNAWGYSPLDQINRQNVQQLQLAWSWSMDDTGAQEAAPLVYDGVMYLPNPRGVIQALDAATGDLIWEYRPGVTPAPAPATGRGGGEQTVIPRLSQQPASAGDTGRGIQKTLAIFGDRIFGTTNDAHIIALNARTGTLVWDTRVADERLGYEYTAGPIVVRGKVIAGITGCGRYKDDVCFITGHDAATGKELWRTSTIARPGEPGDDTCATFWVEDGTADAMLEAIRSECAARQAIAERYLAPYGMLGHPEAFHLWLPAPEGWSPVELASYLRGQGVGVVASAAFSTDGDPPDAVRICLGGPSTLDECERGMHLVADTLQHPLHHHATTL